MPTAKFRFQNQTIVQCTGLETWIWPAELGFPVAPFPVPGTSDPIAPVIISWRCYLEELDDWLLGAAAAATPFHPSVCFYLLYSEPKAADTTGITVDDVNPGIGDVRVIDAQILSSYRCGSGSTTTGNPVISNILERVLKSSRIIPSDHCWFLLVFVGDTDNDPPFSAVFTAGLEIEFELVKLSNNRLLNLLTAFTQNPGAEF